MRLSSRSWGRRRLWLSCVGVVVLVGSGPAASADPRNGRLNDLVSAQAAPAAGISLSERHLTLITGDVLTVRRLPTGHLDASARAVPRPDGTLVTFTKLRSPAGDLYVMPSDAEGLVASGALDRELFNVRALVDYGYADGSRRTLPVIVRYVQSKSASTLRAQTDALPASRAVRALESIESAGVDLAKQDLSEFWADVQTTTQAQAGPRAASLRLDAGLARIWLDKPARAALDQSVPQVGAPQAWQAGLDGTGVKVAILDTGIDATHPDLAGRVVASHSFISNQTVQDGHGHGTHVASIVTGSGAASAGQYRGVAPGAQLLIGKVLANNGSGPTSGIIDGMEWAAANGARVVNMSLGDQAPSNGEDPMTLAVNELTETTGTLFVISAGNLGPDAQTVSSPGAAAAALTVGAVDKQDALAEFSSRGPLIDTLRLKPDLTAPGVDIAAARAAGTSRGTPIDDRYTRLSGTSMAAPHVAGAAAILAQQHPDWRARELKSALTGSAHSTGEVDPYQQGSGRLDIAAAIEQTLLASPSNIDFGGSSSPVSRTMKITNDAAAPITVTLRAQVRDPDGATIDDAVTFSQPTLTVPADGSAQVTVSFDPPAGPFGGYRGLVRALDAHSAVVLRLALSAYREPPSHTLTLRSIPPDNWPSRRITEVLSWWRLLRVDAPQDEISVRRDDTDHAAAVRVPDGVYLVAVGYIYLDPASGDLVRAILVDPEVTVRDADREIIIDARRARRVTAKTPKPGQPKRERVTLVRGTTYGGAWTFDTGAITLGGPEGAGRVAITPTRPVSVGSFRFVADLGLIEPRFRLRVPAPDGPVVQAAYPDYLQSTPRLDAHRQVELVDVGTGSTEEIKGANVRGRVALFSWDWRLDRSARLVEPHRREAFQRLRDAGALAVVAFMSVDRDGHPAGLGGSRRDHEYREALRLPLPVVTVGPETGAALRTLASETRKGRLRVRLDAASRESYTYDLRLEQAGAVPDPPTFTIRKRDLVTIDSHYHTVRPAWIGGSWGAYDRDGVGDAEISIEISMDGPARRTEYLYPASRDLLWSHEITSFDATVLEPGFDDSRDEEFATVFARPQRRTEHWLTIPRVPGAARIRPEVRALGDKWNGRVGGEICAYCRGTFAFWPVWIGVSGDTYRRGDLAFLGEPTDTHLYRDGQEIPAIEPGLPAFDAGLLPPEPARYRLTQHHQPGSAARDYLSDVTTSWEFTSRAPTVNEAPRGLSCYEHEFFEDPSLPCRVEPLLLLGYDLADSLEFDNTIPAPGTTQFDVWVYQQDGAPRSRVKGLNLEVSFDRGKHWQKPKRVKYRGGGRFEVSVKHPEHRKTSGTVSLHAVAWDDAGNRVEQTVLDAYGLRDRSHRHRN